jgi:hypothetical protein
VLAVAVLFGIVVGHRLDSVYRGNATGFALFGGHFAAETGPPRGAVIRSPYGYDGQFFYLQAKDPLLLRDRTVRSFRQANEAFRMQRVAYPALAWVFAFGQRRYLPEALVGLNVFVALAITLGFGWYARRRGWSGWWALAIGFMCGLLTGTLRDLSDPLAVSAMLGGLLLWERRRRWWAAALLAVAVLAREPMALAVVAIAADAAARWWRSRGEVRRIGGADRPGATPGRGGGVPGASRASARAILGESWPVVAVPAVAYVVWQAYVSLRFGGSVASPGSAYKPPFVGVIDEFRHAFDDPAALDRAWDVAYLGLTVAGILAALDLVRRRVSTAAVAAALFGLSLLVLVFGDPWSYTRLSAPMFAALLLGGLELRGRLALGACVAAAALTVAVPFAPWLGSS